MPFSKHELERSYCRNDGGARGRTLTLAGPDMYMVVYVVPSCTESGLSLRRGAKESVTYGRLRACHTIAAGEARHQP